MPKLTQETKNKFYEALDEIVNASGSGTWVERKEDLLEGASEEDKSTLEEFVGWFEGEHWT
jgi:hypothetical protein